MMSDMSSAAFLLQVPPRLQDHPETIEAARLSFGLINKASDSSIVAHRRRAHPEIPTRFVGQVLWAEVGSLAAHAESKRTAIEKCASPSGKATASAPTSAPPPSSPQRSSRASAPTPTNVSDTKSASTHQRTPGSSVKKRAPGPPSLCVSSSKKPRTAA